MYLSVLPLVGLSTSTTTGSSTRTPAGMRHQSSARQPTKPPRMASSRRGVRRVAQRSINPAYPLPLAGKHRSSGIQHHHTSISAPPPFAITREIRSRPTSLPGPQSKSPSSPRRTRLSFSRRYGVSMESTPGAASARYRWRLLDIISLRENAGWQLWPVAFAEP